MFQIALPAGIDASLFLTYLLMGVLGVGLCIARRNAVLSAVALLHAVAGMLTVVAADLITLLIAWELLTFSAYVIIRQGDGHSTGAAFWYLAAQITAAALFFVAIVVNGADSLAVQTLDAAAQPFMTAAVLIKTAMMPLHGWLIGSYTRASYVGSFVLSAYATKVGVYTAARTLSLAVAGLPVLSLVGAAMAVLAVVAALRQHSARRLLSYHIISQVGYMLAGVGLVESIAGAQAGLFHAVNHIVYKGLLFLVVAVVAQRLGHDDLRRMGGLARKMPLVFACAVVGAAAIVGLPLTSRYASKELLKKALGEPQTTLLVAASVGTALSFTKFIYLIFLRRSHHAASTELRTPRFAGAALVVLAALSILIGVAPGVVPGVPTTRFYALDSVLWGVVPAVAGFALWFPLRGILTRGTAHGSDVPPLRRYLREGARPALTLLRRAYRIDPQHAITTAIVGAFLLVAILVFVG
ncbi:MAG: proton-conducting transporter membrane subunit [Spirochaetota bacterium]